MLIILFGFAYLLCGPYMGGGYWLLLLTAVLSETFLRKH